MRPQTGIKGLLKRAAAPAIIRLGRAREAARFSAAPVIIGGCGRSGTTLLLSVLAAHPAIYGIPDETAIFQDWHEEQDDRGYRRLVPVRYDRFYRQLLFRRIPAGKRRWCEKTPRNVHHFDKIIDYFEHRVRLLNIVRDPRDVLTSRHPTRPGKSWVSPARWKYDVRKGLEFGALPEVMTVRYEDLVADLSGTVDRIFRFVGEEPVDIADSWHHRTSVRRNRAWKDGVQRVHSGSVRKWEQDEASVFRVTEDKEIVALMNQLDYL